MSVRLPFDDVESNRPHQSSKTSKRLMPGILATHCAIMVASRSVDEASAARAVLAAFIAVPDAKLYSEAAYFLSILRTRRILTLCQGTTELKNWYKKLRALMQKKTVSDFDAGSRGCSATMCWYIASLFLSETIRVSSDVSLQARVHDWADILL